MSSSAALTSPRALSSGSGEGGCLVYQERDGGCVHVLPVDPGSAALAAGNLTRQKLTMNLSNAEFKVGGFQWRQIDCVNSHAFHGGSLRR